MTGTRRDGTATVYPPMTGREIEEGLAIARTLGPELIEQTGAWYWLDFTDRPSPEARAILSAAGWRWGHKKRRWYLPTVHSSKSKGMGMDYIRDKYGSEALRVEDESPAAAFTGTLL